MVLSEGRTWLRGFWSYYRRYTNTAIHTAATAALAIFGILVFVDPWFAAIAIACYVVPPIVLYVLADESASDESEEDVFEESPSTHADRIVDPTTTESKTGGSSDRRDSISEPNRTAGTDDIDRSSDDGDTNFDSVDIDSDNDGTDTDSDSDGTGTDSDSDGTDTDSDRDD